MPASQDLSGASNEAFGNNIKQVDDSPVRFAVYSGDINRDGFIDLADVTSVYNDAAAFVTGYKATDITGDNITDLSDVTLTYNNSAGFVSALRP